MCRYEKVTDLQTKQKNKMESIEQFKNKIIQGDCLEVMKEIPDKSVDMVLTSPPYDNLRTYKGYTFNFEGIAQEIYRVLKDGGVCVWIVGDATVKGSETGTSFKQALYFKEIGFNLHDTMIYQKSTPPLSHNRYEQNFEYMFILSKGKLRVFNGIREPRRYKDNRKNKAFGKNKDDSIDYGYSSNTDTRLKRNIWKIFAGGGSSDKIASKHPAPFPEQLANDHIISWSNEGDLVYDPFMGSGTTAKMAILNKRNWIGSEISEEYCKIIERRLTTAST